MTGNYNLLLPTLWVCAICFLLADEQSIYRSQAENRLRLPVHQGDYVRQVFAKLHIGRFLNSRQVVPVRQPAKTLPNVIDN